MASEPVPPSTGPETAPSGTPPVPPATALTATPPPPPTPPPANPPPTSPVVQRAPSGNDKMWAILSHVSLFLQFWIILPLIVYLVMRKESSYVAENAKEALNFHISLVIYAICAALLIFVVIGVPLLVLLGIGAAILTIVAAVKAADGEVYRYPLTLRLVR